MIVRRRRGMRMIRVRVGPSGEISVSCPPSTPLRDAAAALEECRDWILAKRVQVGSSVRRTLVRTENGISILSLLGEDVEVVERQHGSWTVQRTGSRLTIGTPLRDAGITAARREELILLWLRYRAREVLAPRVRFWARRMSLPEPRLSCRDQRTLWGSSSSRGVISLNLRLQLLPVEVVDYVVIHELAHQRQMNHSPAFWKEVEIHCPEYREHRRYLRSMSWILQAGRG